MISPIPRIASAKSDGGIRITSAVNREYLVSVICVTRNAAATLPALLTSVSEQKNNDVEFIVIDGASTDGTVDILGEHEHLIDFWISRPDDGIYHAMNDALKYVKGRWVLFLGADDLLLEGFSQMLELLRDPQTIYYGNLLFYGKEFFKIYDDYYLTKLNFCQQAVFYPVTVFTKYRFDLKYRVYADYHLNLRCWHDPEFSFTHADHMIAYFSDGGFSSFEKDLVFERDRDSLFKQYLKRSSYYRYLNRTLGLPRMLARFIQNK